MPQAALSPSDDGRERPDDCMCGDVSNESEMDDEFLAEFGIEPIEIELPCWPCAREGFDTRNPEVGQ